jgi:hypothetical protein
MFKKFNITCDEATTICDKSQYNEASLIEKIQLNWHIFRCKICSIYVKQNRKMTNLFKMKSADCKDENNCMSNTDKEALKRQLEEFKI